MSLISLICIVVIIINTICYMILYSVGHTTTYEKTDDYVFKGIGRGIVESIIMILVYGVFAAFISAILAMFGIVVN